MKNLSRATAALLAVFSMPALADPVISDSSSGYKIPAPGDNIEIAEAYAAKDGHLVFEIWYHEHGVFKNGFFDTKTGSRLFKGREAEIANSDSLKTSLTNKAGLKHIELASNGLPFGDNAKINNHYRDGRTCLWPYGGTIEFLTTDGVPVDGSVLTVVDPPKTKAYERDCEETTGTVQLKTKYRQGFARFFADGNGGAWAILFESPYAIHYDKEGKTSFFKGRTDIVSMSPASLDRIREKADHGGHVAQEDQQALVEKTEGLIDSALAAQTE